jgi:hypothetical protein
VHSVDDPKLLQRVQLLTHEVALIRMIAGRGGEIPFSWERSPDELLDASPRAKGLSAIDRERATTGIKATFVSLINRGILIERIYAVDARAEGSLYIALTDGGRQVADQIFAMDATRRDVPVVESAVQPLDNQEKEL